MTPQTTLLSGAEIESRLEEINKRIKSKDKSAEQEILQLMQLAFASKNDFLLSKLYVLLAKVELLMKFNNNKAVEYGMMAKDLLHESSSGEAAIEALTILGRAHQRLRDYSVAQNYFLEAISLFDNLPNDNPKQQEDFAWLNLFLGTLYVNIGMHAFADEYFNVAQHNFGELNHAQGLLLAKQSLGSNLFHCKNHEKALSILEELIEVYSKSEDENLQIVLDYAGQIYSERGQFDIAEDYHLKALEVRKKIGNEARLSYSYFSLAKICYKTGKRDEGDTYFNLLKDIISRHPEHFTESLLLDIYWDLHGERGDYEISYNYYKKITAHVADPEVLEAMLKTILLNEREKQQQAKLQAQQLSSLNREMKEYAKRLELSNKDLKNYAHVTSHDLREPLRMVSTYMSILESKISDKLDEQEKMFLRFAVDGSKRMDEMITTLLESAKGTATKWQRVDLRNVMSAVQFNLQKLILEKNAEVIFAELPEVNGNEIQLIQVFQNLVSNAIKYNTNSKPRIEISGEESEKELMICVADNGVGIPEEMRETVFEMFSRVENESGAEGTGIGLSTVKKIIERMGGNIWIEGNQPSGTIFKISLPRIAT